jgi:hypothetical protein
MQSHETGSAAGGGGDRRLRSLDLVRGIAVLMILPANIPSFSAPAQLGMAFGRVETWADHAAVLLTRLLVDGRFIALLSILFGAGLAMQVAAAKEAGRPIERYYVRRMALLFVLGIAHALLLWYGDILASYAIVGLGALLFSKVSQRALPWVSGGLIALFCSGLVVLAGMLALVGALALFVEPLREALTSDRLTPGLRAPAHLGGWRRALPGGRSLAKQVAPSRRRSNRPSSALSGRSSAISTKRTSCGSTGTVATGKWSRTGRSAWPS